MKIIKGFESEDIIVSDFGEWVGKNYIDYKAEYENNQKIIKRLLDENKQLKDNWNYIKKMLKEARQEEFNINGYCGTCTDIDIDFLLNKMQELDQGSDSND